MGGSLRGRLSAPNASVLVVVAVSAVLIVVGVVLALSHEGRLREGTNRVSHPQFVKVLGPGEEFCQANEIVPAGAGRLLMRIGTHGPPGPPMTVRFRNEGGLVTTGALKAGWPQGDIEMPIRPIDRTETAEMCVKLAGNGKLAFAGERDIVRTDYLNAEAQTWWERFGAINDRFDEGKSTWYGGWSLVVALVLMLGVAVLAAFTVTRRTP